jgi:hypothetical protein
MSVDGRSQTRRRVLRRTALVGAILALLAILFFSSGHWVLGLIFGAPAVAAIWAFFQLRTVR